jgi:hypothetical protein
MDLLRGFDDIGVSGASRLGRQCDMLSFGFFHRLPRWLSFERGEYYANPQNAFWKIVAGRVPGLPSVSRSSVCLFPSNLARAADSIIISFGHIPKTAR